MPTIVNLPVIDFTLSPIGKICMDKKQQRTGVRKYEKVNDKAFSKRKCFLECKTRDYPRFNGNYSILIIFILTLYSALGCSYVGKN